MMIRLRAGICKEQITQLMKSGDTRANNELDAHCCKKCFDVIALSLGEIGRGNGWS